jgi:hypothetical protein
MRAPRSTSIDREALRVVCDAFDRYEDRIMIVDATNPNHYRIVGEDPVFVEKHDPRTGIVTMGYEPDLDHPYRNRPYHNEAEKDAWLKRLQEADAARARIAKTRERRARRRRGKLTTKPGNYVRGDSVYASHFSRTQPTVHVTKEWAIELTARCLGLDEERFRNSLNRGRRRRRGGPKK